MKYAAASVAMAASLAGLAVYSQVETTALYTISDAHMERVYLQYLAEHGKSYATKEEYLFRLAEFTKKMVTLEEYNAQNDDDAELAVNHMSDWTDDEYKTLLGYKGTKKYNKTAFSGDVNDLPESVNWVTSGAVTPVKN